MPKQIPQILAGAALLLGAGSVLAAADVALVNQLSGAVSYKAGDGAGGTAKAFMKVREGDKFDVPSGGVVRITYFKEGRQETWKGPVNFTAGAAASSGAGGAKPEVAQLPGGVAGKIRAVPDLVAVAKLSRAGGVAVRGLTPKQRASLEQQAEVTAARETYRKLSSQLPSDDITPELYLFSVLQEYLLYDEMKQVALDMKTKQPGNPEVQALVEWVESRNQPGN